MKNFKVSLLVIFIYGCLELRDVDGFSITPFDSDPNHSCKDYFKVYDELYKDVMSDGRSRMFCMTKPGERTEAKHKLAMACLMSECDASPAENHCPVRHINETKYQFDEISRETCTTKNGKPGYTALCCRENSEDAQLASAAGAEPNEFPHIAKLVLAVPQGGSGHCGGTIYNKRFIVTAAHCIVDKSTFQVYDDMFVRQWYVTVGSNSGDMEDKKYRYNVVKATPHEHYSQMSPNNIKLGQWVVNDIALLELDRDIEYGPHVSSLEIAPPEFEPRDYADNTVIIGWGTTNLMAISLNLQKFNFALRNGKHCFEDNQGKKPPHSGYQDYQTQLLCAGGYMGDHGSTTGEGDSGGPAVCRGADGRILHCGVTSYGGEDEDCRDSPNDKNCPPSVFSRVSFFNDWIRKHAGEQDSATFYKPYLYGEPVSTKGKYGHQVHITSDGKPCGGTLVAPNVVVTTASCVADVKGVLRSGVKVHYGMDDMTSKSGVQTFGVTSTKLMDGFRVSGDPVDENVQGTQAIMSDNIYKNNLAVLKLDGEAPVDSDSLPKLPQQGQKFTVAKELAYPRNTTHGGKLLLRDYRLLTRKDCQKRLDRLEKRQGAQGGSDDTQIDENNLCGVEVYSGGSTCDRELGGGLICEGNVLCGVQSFRLCRWSFPNIFVDMSGKPGTWAKDTIKSV